LWVGGEEEGGKGDSKQRVPKLGGTSSNEKGFSANMDVTSYSCFVHHMHAKKEEGLLI